MTDQTTSPAAMAALTPRKRVVAGITSEILLSAAWESLRKLNPRTLARNPVMFLVEVGWILTTLITIESIVIGAPSGSIIYQAALAILLSSSPSLVTQRAAAVCGGCACTQLR